MTKAKNPPTRMGRPKKREAFQSFTFRMPPGLHVELRHAAFDRRMSVNDLLLELVDRAWRADPARERYALLAQASDELPTRAAATRTADSRTKPTRRR